MSKFVAESFISHFLNEKREIAIMRQLTPVKAIVPACEGYPDKEERQAMVDTANQVILDDFEFPSLCTVVSHLNSSPPPLPENLMCALFVKSSRALSAT